MEKKKYVSGIGLFSMTLNNKEIELLDVQAKKAGLHPTDYLMELVLRDAGLQEIGIL